MLARKLKFFTPDIAKVSEFLNSCFRHPVDKVEVIQAIKCWSFWTNYVANEFVSTDRSEDNLSFLSWQEHACKNPQLNEKISDLKITKKIEFYKSF